MFERLIEHFLKFPGIGPRQAKRFGYFLANADKSFVDDLVKLILETQKDTSQCPSCFRLFKNAKNGSAEFNDKCEICSNKNRDTSLLMVVEKDIDFENIEKSKVYNGKYFILGGAISLTGANNKINNLRFKQLFEKIQAAQPAEVILATSATAEGENTARYVEKILEPLRQAQNDSLKITHLGRGLSTGTELEYIDTETMNSALKNRK